jgi:hypothetical protein
MVACSVFFLYPHKLGFCGYRKLNFTGIYGRIDKVPTAEPEITKPRDPWQGDKKSQLLALGCRNKSPTRLFHPDSRFLTLSRGNFRPQNGSPPIEASAATDVGMPQSERNGTLSR